jgi:hypothetical protein
VDLCEHSSTPKRGPGPDGREDARSSKRAYRLVRRDKVVEIAAIRCPVDRDQAKPGVRAKQPDNVVLCELLGTGGNDGHINALGARKGAEIIRCDERSLDNCHIGFRGDRLLDDFAKHPRNSEQQDSDGRHRVGCSAASRHHVE